MAPLDMFTEQNTKCNLPAQVDIAAVDGNSYEFLFIAKGGGSANKTFLYQQTKVSSRTGDSPLTSFFALFYVLSRLCLFVPPALRICVALRRCVCMNCIQCPLLLFVVLKCTSLWLCWPSAVLSPVCLRSIPVFTYLSRVYLCLSVSGSAVFCSPSSISPISN